MKSPWRQLWHPKYWIFAPLLGLLYAITHLPYRTQMRIGKALGKFLLVFNKKSRHTTQINLELCFPELTPEARTQLLRDTYASMGMSIMETAMAWFAKDSQLPPITYVGFERWQQFHKEGQGILFVSAHLSCLEIIGRLIKDKLIITSIYRPQKIQLLDIFAKFYRAKFMAKIVAREQLRELMRGLTQDESVWYTPDVDAGIKNSIFVPFFNIPTATITTPPRLAARTNALTMTLFMYRKKDLSGYEIHLSEPLENFPSGDDEQDMARINQLIEAAIRVHPEQYLWQYKRFKTRPPGEKRFYQNPINPSLWKCL